MSPEVLKTITISVLFFSIFVVLPVLYFLMDHQRKMVRLMRGEHVDETETAMVMMGAMKSSAPSAAELAVLTERIRALESEVALLKATQADQEIALQQRTR